VGQRPFEAGIDTVNSLRTENMRKWALLLGVIAAFIIVPFIFFGPTFDAIADRAMTSEQGKAWSAVVLFSLLATDSLLPIPSSIVAPGLITLMGFLQGVLAVFAGTFLSALMAYGIGRAAGSGMMRRLVPESQIDGARPVFQRYTLFSVFISRGVPILAEASAIFAGSTRIPFRPFALVALISSFVLAVLYGCAFQLGLWYLNSGSAVVVTAVVIPAISWLGFQVFLRRVR